MHHLIFVREIDQQMSGSGCCGRIEGDAVLWDSSECIFPERRERMNRIGEFYRAVKDAFGEAVKITIVDPRNLVSFVPLVLRDAFRYRVPARAVLKALGSTSLATAVFDGEVLFSGTTAWEPADVIDSIRARLAIQDIIQTSV